MINWIDEKKPSNPVRSHIQMSFGFFGDESEIIKFIVKDLQKNNFDENKSCVLIFAHSRKGTEEASMNLKEALVEAKVDYAEKVDHYHAGLDGFSREEKYDKYKNGEIVILIATKAFGMGMDIKNIHFIYHLGPSSTFEDYLQEVGRAGRNEDKRKVAGFSVDNPIQSKCLMIYEDFRRLKDRHHNSQITWNQVNQVRKTVFEYVSRFRPLQADNINPFPLPQDLLDQFIEYSDIKDKETFLRVILYWLEKLERIKLGVFTPTHLPIKLLQKEINFSKITLKDDRDSILLLVEVLKNYKFKKYPNAEILMVDMAFLKEKVKLKSTVSLFKILFKAQKAGALTIERTIALEPTFLRTDELKEWNHNQHSLIINAVFDFAEKLINLSKPEDQVYIEGKELDRYLGEISQSHIFPDNIFWKEIKNKKNEYRSKEEIAEKQLEDFFKKRSKFAFKLINFLPKVRHKSLIEIDGVNQSFTIQLIYNGYKKKEIPLRIIKEFKTNLISFISYISRENIKKNISKFNIVDLIIQLGLEDKGEEYLQNLIYISKALGYLKGKDGGGLTPIGVELFINDMSNLEDDSIGSRDYLVKQEFIESSKMKEVRLIALECLSRLKLQEQDEFIKRYFQCREFSDLISLLEEKLGENHQSLKGFRDEALNKEKEKLNVDQLKVYKALLSENIQVIAGPGSGKTHTLTLRVARLIHEEKVDAGNILILAYNRAVVVELKERLTKLFKDLGYFKIIKRLRVFTFYGFIKYCITDEIENLDFSLWTPTFLRFMNDSPGLIAQKLGNIKYIFVDEFQDITSERLELLEKIANPETTRLCVIGDPNQSIYGYEKANLDGKMDPKPYYDKFNEIFKPKELFLSINYRSYSEILVEAAKLLHLNTNRFPMPELIAKKEAPYPNNKVCEIINYREDRVDWKSKIMELLLQNNSEIKQIAVMFRSNNEVFRAFNVLRNENLTNVRLRIQGSKGTLYKTREFHYLLSKLNEKSIQSLNNDYATEINELKLQTISKYPNWDKYLLNIFHCLAIEFEKESSDGDTYWDLIEFIKELSSKDDGHFGKIYEQNIKKIEPNIQETEIVFTTMHKVKGLEFDAVVIPASFSNLPFKETTLPLLDIIEEERRLYYVAYTRAKKKLIVIKYDREMNMDLGQSHNFPPELIKNNYGIAIDEGIDKFTLYWSASVYGGISFTYIRDNVKVGDSLILEPILSGGFVFWHAIVNGTKIARLSSSMVHKIGHLPRMNGFIVSSVYVSTYEETIWSDENNGTNYSSKWTQDARERGYVYLIDFSGYGN